MSKKGEEERLSTAPTSSGKTGPIDKQERGGQTQKMTSQQVWSFLPVAALLLLLSVHTSAEVVESMSDCSQFFLDQTPPHIPGVLEDGEILDQNRYKPICQTFNNTRRFVTLYDTQNKIPVFSAFKFVGDNKPESTTSTAIVVPKGLWFVGNNKPESSRVDKKRHRPCWKIEPQLEDETADKNMQPVNNSMEYDHQAGNVDYKNSTIFDRGHIFPRFYASTDDDKKSTFTLTNIVPQVKSFNQGSWNKMEWFVKCVMEKYCNNSNGRIEGFVVTGAQPSNGSFLNNRVNVPSALWSAFCCYNANEKAWIASAHWGDNVPDEPDDKILETITLEALYQKLNMSDTGFIFSGINCPLQTTVTKFYPEMNTGCSCPPSTNPESPSTASGSFAPSPPLLMCQEFLQFNEKQIFGSIEEILRVITQLQLESTHGAQILGAETDSDLFLYPKTITRSAFCRRRIISRIKGLMSQQDLEELTDAVVFYELDHCNIVFTCFPLKVDQTAGVPSRPAPPLPTAMDSCS
ncbi:uncharacterized protein V3H82_014068 [Fundulus diaphanus]